jgi:hypothetical protein
MEKQPQTGLLEVWFGKYRENFSVVNYFFKSGLETPVCLALPMLSAAKSIILYNLAQRDPGLGVGVIAAIADAVVTTLATTGNHGWALKI